MVDDNLERSDNEDTQTGRGMRSEGTWAAIFFVRSEVKVVIEGTESKCQ